MWVGMVVVVVMVVGVPVVMSSRGTGTGYRYGGTTGSSNSVVKICERTGCCHVYRMISYVSTFTRIELLQVSGGSPREVGEPKEILYAHMLSRPQRKIHVHYICIDSENT